MQSRAADAGQRVLLPGATRDRERRNWSGTFAFSDELADKRRQLSEIDDSLSQDIDGVRPTAVQAA